MLDTIDLDFGITCIDTGYVRPQMTACYLMQQGDAAALIETGVNRNVPGILELLDSRGISRDQVEYIMPTHVHLDHAGGVGALMQALPNAQLVIHPRGARHMIDPSRLSQGTIAVYGEEKFHRFYGELLPVDEQRVMIADDGYMLDFNGRMLEFLDTPGHARHHYCIVDSHSNGIFTGDTMGISYPALQCEEHYTFPTTTPVQFDPPALHVSIDRLMARQPDRLYLTHFGCVEQVKLHATQLHRDIDAFVEMTKSLPEAEDNETTLRSLLADHLYKSIGLAGSPLEQADFEAIMQMDIELNSQGLLHWAKT
jgi:glyoxylase-like metal-dependent hydrolase (beta-lactamase superfamily II)